MSTETVQLWRCDIHGYVQDADRKRCAPEHDNPQAPPADYRFCPIGIGYDEVCDTQLEGPVTATIAGHKQNSDGGGR